MCVQDSTELAYRTTRAQHDHLSCCYALKVVVDKAAHVDCFERRADHLHITQIICTDLHHLYKLKFPRRWSIGTA